MKTRNWILVAAGLIFVGMAVLPVGLMFFDSFRTPEGLSLANYSRLLVDSRQRQLLANSLVLALSTSTLATVLGVPLGFFLARTDLNSKHWWRLSLIIPLVIPPYILGISWIFSTNLLARMAQGSNSEIPPGWIYGLPGAILVLSLSYYPIPMLVTEGALNRVQSRLEEAAWLIAGWRRTLFSITFPLILPAVAAGFLLVFILALAELSVPSLLRVRVFATEVYTQFAAFFNFGAATAAATPLLFIILVIAILIRILLGEKLITSRQGSSSSPLLAPQSWVFPGQCFLLAVLISAVCVPLISLVVKVGSPEIFWQSTKESLEEIFSSLILSGVATILSVGLGLLIGYWRGRTLARWRALVDVLWLLLFTLPGTVLGIGLVQLWNRPGAIGIYGTWKVLLLGLVGRFTPISALLLAANVRHIPISLEEAALVHGSSWWRVFSKIVIPNMKRGLLATGLLVFILAFAEVAITILLIPPGVSTLPLRIFTTITNSPDHVMAALCLLQTAVILVSLFLAHFVTFQYNRRSMRTVNQP